MYTYIDLIYRSDTDIVICVHVYVLAIKTYELHGYNMAIYHSYMKWQNPLNGFELLEALKPGQCSDTPQYTNTPKKWLWKQTPLGVKTMDNTF